MSDDNSITDKFITQRRTRLHADTEHDSNASYTQSPTQIGSQSMMTDIDVRPLDEEYLSDLYAMAKTPATASSQRKASMEKQLSDQIEQITI